MRLIWQPLLQRAYRRTSPQGVSIVIYTTIHFFSPSILGPSYSQERCATRALGFLKAGLTYFYRLITSGLYGYYLRSFNSQVYYQYLRGPLSYLAIKQSPQGFIQESITFLRFYLLELTLQSLYYNCALDIRICRC